MPKTYMMFVLFFFLVGCAPSLVVEKYGNVEYVFWKDPRWGQEITGRDVWEDGRLIDSAHIGGESLGAGLGKAALIGGAMIGGAALLRPSGHSTRIDNENSQEQVQEQEQEQEQYQRQQQAQQQPRCWTYRRGIGPC